MSETVRAVALFGLVVFVPGAIVYQVGSPQAVAVVIAVGWAGGLLYIPLGTWIRERGHPLGLRSRRGLGVLIIVQIVITVEIAVVAILTQSASWGELVGGLVAAAIVITGTFYWGRSSFD